LSLFSQKARPFAIAMAKNNGAHWSPVSTQVPASLDERVKLGGMNEFHAAASASETRVISF
jgi:hypothetical protein